MSTNKTLLERFEEKYVPEPNTGCWLWIGCSSGELGHGQISTGPRGAGRSSNMEGAHRVAWRLFRGRIGGSVVRHRCDVPYCVHPDHLELGSQKQNIQDAIRRRRWPVGSRSHRAKLTEHQVREIRALKGKVPAASLARRYGLQSQSTITWIWSRKTWRHVR